MNCTYTELETLFSRYPIKTSYEQKDNYIIEINNQMKFTFYKGNKVFDFYINETYFGDLNNQDLEALFHAIMTNEIYFVFYRKPRGGLKKEHFSIEQKAWFQKNKSKLENQRGIKVMTLNETLIDIY